MWKQFFDLIKEVATLTQATDKNRADIKVLQDQMAALTETVRDMAHAMQRDRDNQAHEREKLLLRLENALLRSKQRTLTGRPVQPLLPHDTEPPVPSQP